MPAGRGLPARVAIRSNLRGYVNTPATERYRALLEAYIDAKDNNRPQRIGDVFARDAELAFSLATENIAFPSRVAGADAIARTLVTDFGARYSQCRTYYVCDALQPRNGSIAGLPWLVVMREPEAGALRIGHGVYDWTFSPGIDGTEPRVAHFHIQIARMDVIADHDARLLAQVHERLPYPWLSPVALRDELDALRRAAPAFAFVAPFTEPAVPLASLTSPR